MDNNYVTVTQTEWDCRVKEVDLDAIQEFYDWLQEKVSIPRMSFANPPKLEADTAFAVIYYLQERLGIVKDTYEKCRQCGEIYDSDNEGTHIDRDSYTIDEEGKEVALSLSPEWYGHYCDECRPD